MSDISIIVPTVARGIILQESLDSILADAAHVGAEVILVDDSRTGSVEVKSRGVTLLRTQGRGAATARNAGAAAAHGPLLLFIDDDIIVPRGSLMKVLAHHRRFKRSAFNFNWKYPQTILDRLEETPFGRFLLDARRVDYRGWVPDIPWSETGFVEVPKLAAFFLSIEKSEFEALGGFDESFRDQGVEDDEFSARLRAAKVRQFIDVESYVLHNEADRLGLRSRMERFRSGARNKKKGLAMGFGEYRLDYSKIRRIILSASLPFKPALMTFMEAFPNVRMLDGIFFLLAKALIAITIFEGYFEEAENPIG